MAVAETIQVAVTVALTVIEAVAGVAAPAMGAIPSARIPRMAAATADFIAFESFIE
jgi:hypothetical protein